MNLEDYLFTNKRSLTLEQEFNLIDLLSFRTTMEVKLKVKTAIKTKLYTFFDGNITARQFEIVGNSIEFKSLKSNSYSSELSNIRKNLLKTLE
jgi:hypothetical protein